MLCGSETPLSDVKGRFSDYGLDAIPVVDKDGVALGVVDSRSIETLFRDKALSLRSREMDIETGNDEATD